MILLDPSGLDLAEFAFFDPESETGCYRAWDFQHCLAGDTRVLTPEGHRPIRDLVGKATVLTERRDRQGKWVEVAVHWYGQRPVQEIELERYGVRQVIRATSNHRWFAGQGKAGRRTYDEVFTRDLRPGMFLKSVWPQRSGQLKIAPYGVVHGMVWGDGTRASNGACNLVLWGEKRELAEYLVGPGVPVQRDDVAVPGLRWTLLPASFKEPVRFDEAPSYLYGWLAGYFATDGSVAPDGTCQITSVSQEALELVRDVCVRLGITVGQVAEHLSGPSGYGGEGTYYAVTLRSSDLAEDFFLRPSHLAHWRNRRSEYAPREWKVVEVRDSGDMEDVYCAAVPETHSFVLDGYILTGNSWYRDESAFQVDQGARSCGKSVGVTIRSASFPFTFSGQAMLITAPELVHLRPLTDAIEGRLLATRILREMLPATQGKGIARQPHWQVRFKNGTRIVSRLPQKDGKGVKGNHVIRIELDEAQDYPPAGWVEIVECLNRGLPGASWRCHGVPKGVRDRFWEITEGAKDDEDIVWKNHRPMAMQRPTWSQTERNEKIRQYGGSRQHVDYKRNIYGEHGDASSVVFVLAKLTACVDLDEGSRYNSEIYTRIPILLETLPKEVEDRRAHLASIIRLPGEHKTGWSQQRDRKEVGAPHGYESYWGGMDVGVTNHPSEILICGQRRGSDHMDLLTRIHLQRVNTDDQMFVVELLFSYYGDQLRGFAIDTTGVGFPLGDSLSRNPQFGSRVHGFNFSSKVPVGFEDRAMTGAETMKDLVIERNVVEAATDWLRNDYIDVGKMRLPFDREVLLEFQGQTYSVQKDSGSPYGTRRVFSGGSFHSLDAMKMVMAGKFVPPLVALLDHKEESDAILDLFVGGF